MSKILFQFFIFNYGDSHINCKFYWMQNNLLNYCHDNLSIVLELDHFVLLLGKFVGLKCLLDLSVRIHQRELKVGLKCYFYFEVKKY